MKFGRGFPCWLAIVFSAAPFLFFGEILGWRKTNRFRFGYLLLGSCLALAWRLLALIARATSADMIEQHYSPKQIADLLGVSLMTISRMVKAGKFEIVRCGGRVLIPESAVRRFLDANRIRAKEDIPLGSTSQAPSKLLESTFQEPLRRGRRPLISYL